jgi:hypothetical protein
MLLFIPTSFAQDIVQHHDESLSLTDFVVDPNSPLEPQLCALTLQLVQQNPCSSVASVDVSSLSWMFKEDGEWYVYFNFC